MTSSTTKKSKGSTTTTVAKRKVSRPGIHAKTKHSKLKSSKLYKKSYRGQGK
jgi:hypothetical protein